MVRIHGQDQLTNLKQMQQTKFVFLLLVFRSQDEHPGYSATRTAGSESKLTPFSFSSSFYFVTFKFQSQSGFLVLSCLMVLRFEKFLGNFCCILQQLMIKETTNSAVQQGSSSLGSWQVSRSLPLPKEGNKYSSLHLS